LIPRTEKEKKILIIAESINVEDSSGSKANVALIKNLKYSGFDVLVYHYTRREISLDSIPCISIKENRRSWLFYLSRLQRKLQHTFKWNLAKYLEPLFGFSFTFLNDSKSISKCLKSIKGFNPDLILTLSKGASFRPHHALLRMVEFHDRWMAYIHDPYPFHLYPEPFNWSEPGYKQKIDFFNQVSKKCQWTAFPSLLLAEWMQKPFPHFVSKTIIIPHQIINEKQVNDIKLPDYFDNSKFNLLHAGTLLPERNPLPLIMAFEEFILKYSEEKENIRLIFIGNFSNKFDFLKEKHLNVPQILCSKYLNFDIVRNMQNLSSVNIILESVAGLSPFLPGKFPNCISANKPILHLGPEKSEVRRLLGFNYEFCAEADDVEKIFSVIEELYKKWKSVPESLKLQRDDLQFYLSDDYLKKQINNLK